MSDHWYDSLAHNRTAEGSRSEQAGADVPSGRDPVSDTLFHSGPDTASPPDPGGEPSILDSDRAPTHSEMPLRSTDSGLATIVRLQSSELERLARENARLMDRIETLLRLQEREQVLRQQMQAQIGQLGDRIAEWQPKALAAPAADPAEAGEREEIKPVLLAMLDLLERMAPGATARAVPQPTAAEAAPTAAVPQPEMVSPATETEILPSAEASGDLETVAEDPHTNQADEAEVDGGTIRLPEILTRPIEDLTTARRTESTTAAPGKDTKPVAQTPASRSRRPHDEAKRRGAPAMFAWTSIFS